MAPTAPKAPKHEAVSFDAIIKSDRQKKQNEQLASQILGKNRKGRRASAPGPGAVQKGQASKPGSLASRIGVPKRSASTSFRTNTKPAPAAPARSQPKPSHPTKPSKPTKPTNSTQKRRSNAERLLSALESGNSQATVRQSSGLSIKGASGPFVVVGSNFAPGTTAADIQSALEPTSGPTLSCRVISHSPTVTAEIAYADKWNAENVIANYDNQRADGRLLTMKLKTTGSDTQLTHSQGSYNDQRKQADQERRRRARPSVQDGRYGFGENRSSAPGLYSDEMMVDSPQNKPRRNRQH
ncbi:hypothetical protein N7492_005128 [Penicillium capsulatum]|uniref:RRM domain-containing protein n=1 Tax=Penicillium capsulatum TaxID=69766 RepID=A0A9W9IBQ3_9EURO|nr:hypothetical protein N7492_005128 [Penicillium capsulatum]KAJ6135766.1 hypothetical protein N7512_000926 [Penicillium capsulatum]